MQKPRADEQLIQYRVAADHRLHFGRLFFHVTAFNLALALALFVVAAGKTSVHQALAIAGVVLLGTAIVSGRLLRQERLYATALAAIERARPDFVEIEPAQSNGARTATVMGLAAIGLLLLVPLALRGW